MPVEPTITRGWRGPENKRPEGLNNPQGLRRRLASERLGFVPQSVGDSVRDKDKLFKVILQSEVPAYHAQLSAPSGIELDTRSGTRRVGKPLALKFAKLGGYCILDLRNETDRRSYRLVVGHDAWAKRVRALGLSDAVHPEDPEFADPHPRYGFGLKFWDVEDAAREVAKARRRAVVETLANDTGLLEAMQSMTIEQLQAELNKHRQAGARKASRASELQLNIDEVDDAHDSNDSSEDLADKSDGDAGDESGEEDSVGGTEKPKPSGSGEAARTVTTARARRK